MILPEHVMNVTVLGSALTLMLVVVFVDEIITDVDGSRATFGSRDRYMYPM